MWNHVSYDGSSKVLCPVLWLNRNSMGDASCFQWKQPHDNNATKTQGLIRLTNKWTNTDTALFFHPHIQRYCWTKKNPKRKIGQGQLNGLDTARHLETKEDSYITALLGMSPTRYEFVCVCVCMFQALKKNKRWGIPWARRTNWAHIDFLLALS